MPQFAFGAGWGIVVVVPTAVTVPIGVQIGVSILGEASSVYVIPERLGNWMMASVPRDNQDASNPIFPEAFLNDTTLGGVNRAHLSWYSIDQQISGSDPNPYSAIINQTEVFPNRTQQNTFGAQLLRSLDMSYDPTRRGPYNFDPPDGTQFSAGLNSDGTLKEPEERWAGVMRQMTTNDFQSSNIEFLEFWLMSPFLDTTGAQGGNPDALTGEMNGELIINFGNVSEDIMPDSRKFFENGLPGTNSMILACMRAAQSGRPITLRERPDVAAVYSTSSFKV